MKPTTSPWDWKYLGNIPGVCTSEVLQGPTLSRHLNKSQRTDTPLDNIVSMVFTGDSGPPERAGSKPRCPGSPQSGRTRSSLPRGTAGRGRWRRSTGPCTGWWEGSRPGHSRSPRLLDIFLLSWSCWQTLVFYSRLPLLYRIFVVSHEFHQPQMEY